ncbi:hypothetical protein [Pyxidicoccus trucidator]|uniref:hypothetical protein n=1 Tax=Pyxidicoccus trucidator TaxID=2709662 RepID=UPI0019680D56|nr:hypothetical protein [Pyxidicoccus trucidator]
MRLISFMAPVALVLLLASACGESSNPPEPSACGPMTCDGGPSDAGDSDAGDSDAGDSDAGDSDAGVPDAGPQGTFILFDPRGLQPVIPEPNDLHINPDTGLLSLPVVPGDSAAQQEFTRDYLNTLDGFPEIVTATAGVSAALEPTTVTRQTVRVLQLSGPATPLPPIIAYNEDTRRILAIATTGWARGAQYAVAVLGGDSGVKDTMRQPVTGSPAWQWVRSTTPLVDGSGRSTVPGLPDSDAPPMERLRLRYAPYLDQLVAEGIRREDVAALWTFTTSGRPRVTFDPALSIVPFPSNVYLSPNGPRVSLPPAPPGAGVLLTETLAGLNTLDGFSTTAVIVSENSPTHAALDQGLVAPDSLAAGTLALRLDGTGAEPSVVACLGCASSPGPDGSPPSGPQELQFVPQLPLDEGTTYATVITTALRDLTGRQVTASRYWALLRLAAPLIDGQGRSQLTDLPDVLALQLEPLRQAFKPMLDTLEARGLRRSQVALANSFRTQSTLSVLTRLSALAEMAPAAPAHVLDASHQLPSLGVPHDQLGGYYEAWVPVANLLTGPGGTIGGIPPRLEQAQLVLTVPNTARPAEGWPVVLFAHDFAGGRGALLFLANELARAGFAAAAMDAVHHGERSHCVGSRFPQSDDEACADPATQRCETNAQSPGFGRCVARDPRQALDCTAPAGGIPGDVYCAQASQGRCVSVGEGTRACEGGTFKQVSTVWRQPAISGWNMLNPARPFASRDNFRQAAVDLRQLVRVLRSPELATALGTVKLDTTQLHFVGAGMGAMVGSLFLAVNNDVQRAVLNVPGADPMGLLLTSPGLAGQRSGYLSRLASEGLVQGTPSFDMFLRYQRMAFDAADPWNAARALADRPGAPAGREVFIQYIAGNDFIPTPLTGKFIAAANAGQENRCPVSLWNPVDLPAQLRHGFLLQRVGDGTLADAAQRQVATFLGTGTVTAPPSGAR